MKNFTLLFALTWTGIVAAQNFQTTIEANNVRANVISEGLLFNNLAFSTGGYEVPKLPLSAASRPSAIYSSTLWLGGLDNGGNVHLAGQTYRQQGKDFKAGPLDPGTGMPVTGKNYDTLWRITRADLDALHHGTITPNVANWPTEITTSLGKRPLAPFWDKNGNGTYEPANGEEPIFPGDEALFFVYNDNTIHAETGGATLGMEVRGFVYQFSSANEFLNNTTFVDYTIINHSINTYHGFKAGVWTDFDLGNFSDDNVGTDSLHNMYYAYNGDDTDSGLMGYGSNPPAMGVIFLTHTLQATMAYSADFTVSGSPLLSEHYLNYMNGIWKDGEPMTEGGNGYKTSNKVTKYVLSGNPVSNTGWTEKNSGVAVGDRRMLGSISLGFLGNMAAGSQEKFTVAYLWARSNAGGALPSVGKLFKQTDSLIAWYNHQLPLGVKPVSAEEMEIKIYPNPASGIVQVDVPAPLGDNMSLAVYDVSGKKVISTTEAVFDVSALAKGLYIVRGEAGGVHFSQKLIVQ